MVKCVESVLWMCERNFDWSIFFPFFSIILLLNGRSVKQSSVFILASSTNWQISLRSVWIGFFWGDPTWAFQRAEKPASTELRRERLCICLDLDVGLILSKQFLLLFLERFSICVMANTFDGTCCKSELSATASGLAVGCVSPSPRFYLRNLWACVLFASVIFPACLWSIFF